MDFISLLKDLTIRFQQENDVSVDNAAVGTEEKVLLQEGLQAVDERLTALARMFSSDDDANDDAALVMEQAMLLFIRAFLTERRKIAQMRERENKTASNHLSHFSSMNTSNPYHRYGTRFSSDGRRSSSSFAFMTSLSLLKAATLSARKSRGCAWPTAPEVDLRTFAWQCDNQYRWVKGQSVRQAAQSQQRLAPDPAKPVLASKDDSFLEGACSQPILFPSSSVDSRSLEMNAVRALLDELQISRRKFRLCQFSSECFSWARLSYNVVPAKKVVAVSSTVSLSEMLLAVQKTQFALFQRPLLSTSASKVAEFISQKCFIRSSNDLFSAAGISSIDAGVSVSVLPRSFSSGLLVEPLTAASFVFVAQGSLTLTIYPSEALACLHPWSLRSLDPIFVASGEWPPQEADLCLDGVNQILSFQESSATEERGAVTNLRPWKVSLVSGEAVHVPAQCAHRFQTSSEASEETVVFHRRTLPPASLFRAKVELQCRPTTASRSRLLSALERLAGVQRAAKGGPVTTDKRKAMESSKAPPETASSPSPNASLIAAPSKKKRSNGMVASNSALALNGIERLQLEYEAESESESTSTGKKRKLGEEEKLDAQTLIKELEDDLFEDC